jgi:hypothetical protein
MRRDGEAARRRGGAPARWGGGDAGRFEAGRRGDGETAGAGGCRAARLAGGGRVRYRGAMKRIAVVIALVMAAAVNASAAPGASKEEWTVDPPSGWHEDAALAQQLIGTLKTGLSKLEGMRTADIDSRVWRAPDQQSALLLQWYRIDLGSDIRGQINDFDRGVQESFVAKAKAEVRPERIEGGQIRRDVIVASLGGKAIRARMVRTYQPAEDGLHLLVLTCTSGGSAPACDTAIDASRLVVAGAVPLSYRGRSSTSFMIGYAMGLLLAAGIGVWILLRVLRRRRS